MLYRKYHLKRVIAANRGRRRCSYGFDKKPGTIKQQMSVQSQ